MNFKFEVGDLVKFSISYAVLGPIESIYKAPYAFLDGSYYGVTEDNLELIYKFSDFFILANLHKTPLWQAVNGEISIEK